MNRHDQPAGARIRFGVIAAAALSVALHACVPSGGGPPPPETREEPVTDEIHGVEYVDPFRWLEDQDDPETRAWLDEQNAYADEVLEPAAEIRAAFRERLRELIDTPDVGTPTPAGAVELFTLRRPGEPVASIVRRPVPDDDAGDDGGEDGDTDDAGERRPPDQPIDPQGEYEVVVDPLEIRPDGTTSVSILSVSPGGRYLLYGVRDGGRDEIGIHVRDLEAGEDLPDRLPTALYGSSFLWDAGDAPASAFLYVHRSRRTGPRVRLHRLGTGVTDDRAIFGAGHGPTRFISVSRIDDDSKLLFDVQHGWRRTELHVVDVADDGITPAGPVRAIVDDADALVDARFHEGLLYLRTHLDAPNYRLVAVDPDRPSRSRWHEVLPGTEDVLRSVTFIDGRLFAGYLRDAAWRIRGFELPGAGDGDHVDGDHAEGADAGASGTDERRAPGPFDPAAPTLEVDVPELASASIRGAGDGRARLTVESFMRPPTTWEIDLGSGERTLWKEPDAPFDATGFQVRRLWTESKDGTRVPYFVVHRGELETDGGVRTLLYGYGGFNAALTPRFDARAAAWVEAGGVFAQAVLRGGGEFGDDWHRDGFLEDKQHVFDDFIAVAEDLIDRGITSPERLAIRGVSNGGLLMGAVLTQRPGLFGAVFCGMPDLDMVRFPTFEETNNKPALLEYGDGRIPEQFEFLRQYSPYQAVEEGTSYPPVMLLSGDLDTRVPPPQARKMTARLQAATSSGRPVILRYRPRAGHAGGRTVRTRIEDAAAELAFLWWQLGSGDE